MIKYDTHRRNHAIIRFFQRYRKCSDKCGYELNLFKKPLRTVTATREKTLNRKACKYPNIEIVTIPERKYLRKAKYHVIRFSKFTQA